MSFSLLLLLPLPFSPHKAKPTPTLGGLGAWLAGLFWLVYSCLVWLLFFLLLTSLHTNSHLHLRTDTHSHTLVVSFSLPHCQKPEFPLPPLFLLSSPPPLPLAHLSTPSPLPPPTTIVLLYPDRPPLLDVHPSSLPCFRPLFFPV
ncbi:uncharacterized protein BO97DRAFT_52415 [Aspergillus homomorphus CBS 101889]|uniref:Uncharacterized protein n=1 Tax=Aspergillus homomorphus (strain CBS 101889) TaxID=1450537 RepID=A0A395HZ00_ASPHC|nr:hypothetical protein BO97DRAFT_52415 [Aspergillus homomorphus CBS 101889]RAL12695.1 hypothetical protein BO97DRAFT_52415 [Aspergillus homomorphus CBS 101889]